MPLPLREYLPRVGQLRPCRIRLRSNHHKLLEMRLGPSLVACTFGREARTVETAEAVRLFGDGGLILYSASAGWPSSISMSPRSSRAGKIGPGDHHVLLGLILMVGGGAHGGESFLMLAFGVQRPGGGDLRLDLGLLGPVGELPFSQYLL